MTNVRSYYEIKIFVSSPGDVYAERQHIIETINNFPIEPYSVTINGEGFDVKLKAVAYDAPKDRVVMPNPDTPMVAISDSMANPSECDIVIVLFWARMGTPLPFPDHKKENGTPYLSGTEWEYEDALQAYRKNGKPEIYVYHRTEVPSIPLNDPDYTETQQQWQRVQEFFAKFVDESGSIRRAKIDYASSEKFLETFKNDFSKMLKNLITKINNPEEVFIRPEKERLIDELDEATLSHERRKDIGQRLFILGDPRKGIGLSKGLPDIEWCELEPQRITIKQHTFDVNRFYIAKYPITYIQFQSFVDRDDGFNQKHWWENLYLQREEVFEQLFKADNYPRTRVSWYHALAFTRWLSSKQDTLELPMDIQNRSTWEIRLPTEWEWEIAATGGNPENIYPWGEKWDTTKTNTLESELSRVIAVGMYPEGKSPVGALDMAGNVREWCLNKYEPLIDTGLDGSDQRVTRGGSWSDFNTVAQTTVRSNVNPVEWPGDFGFRICLVQKDK